MQRIAVGWLAWELTKSPAWLGVIAFADLFPAVLVGPFAGAVADRWDRLRLIQAMQLLSCSQALALFILSSAGWIRVEVLALLSLFLGIVTALNQPARLALVPSLVEPEHLNSAIGINSVIFNLARFLGPAIAGGVIAAGEISWVFGLNAVSFAIFLAILMRLRLTVPSQPRRDRKAFLADLGDGIAYTVRTPHISLPLLLLIAIGIAVRPLVELLPGLAAAVFAGGAETLALLTSTLGGGAVIGGLWLAGRDHRSQLAGMVLAATLVQSAALTLFVATQSLWVAVPSLAVLGTAMVVTGAGIQTLLQVEVRPEMRGRVLSLYGLIIRGGPAVGALAMGAIAEVTGLRLPLAAGAALVALAAIAIGAVRRRRKKGGR